VDVKPAASWPVTVTVLTPTLKEEPDEGENDTEVPAQLSETEAVYVAVAAHELELAVTVIELGHDTVGFCLSSTVTVN